MIGAIIGDIVGSRFEFDNYLKTDFDFFHLDCSFTDDTVCTMAVADWIVRSVGQEIRSPFAFVLQSWCRRYPSPMGGYGGRFSQWINNPVPYNSFGNGSAMRISPVADFFSPNTGLENAVNLVTCVSHDHPEGMKGAMAVAVATNMAHAGASKAQLKKAMVELYGYNLNSTCAKIRKTNTFNETCQVTVPQALVCFLESVDFESAIRLAVSIGGDSDTIAAIVGSIAEAFYGVPGWMKEKAMARLPSEMNILIRKFYKLVGDVKVRTSN